MMWVWSSHDKKIQTKFDLETTLLLYIVTPSGVKNIIVCRQIGEIQEKFDLTIDIADLVHSFQPSSSTETYTFLSAQFYLTPTREGLKTFENGNV